MSIALKPLLLLLFLPFLFSCGVVTEKAENYPAAITSTSNPDLRLGRGARIAVDPVAKISLPGDPQVQNQLQEILTETLAAELKARGFEVSSAARSDYLIGYAVVLDSAMTDNELGVLFGLAPGYAGGASQVYKRGTLLLDLHETQSRINVWRGALQTELVEGLSDRQRKRRVEIAINRLMRVLVPDGNLRRK